MKKIIIIGNASSILNANKKKEINSFDIVIRCNSFQIKGYENYVGTKTDIISIIGSGAGLKDYIKNYKNNSKNIKTIWFSRPKNLCFKQHKKIITPDKIIKYPSTILFKKLQTKLNNFKNLPSTGMVTMEMALDIFKQPLYVTGFDFFETQHYYSNKNKKIGKSHPAEAEKKLIYIYKQQNKVKEL